MPLTISTILNYYKRREIQEAILNSAKDKEIAVRYSDKGYGKRPDTLAYANDIIAFAQQGATSFHCSEELWNNPLEIKTGTLPEELNAIRKGWDLVLDIDSPHLAYSRIAANLVIQALQHYNIQNISVKFSGNHGWHIGIPFEAFPEKVNGKETKNLFPEGPRKIAALLMRMIKQPLTIQLLTKETETKIARNIGKPLQEITIKGASGEREFNPFAPVHIDTVLISPRHLYRMPYSLNEKSGLSSIPINPDEILTFTTENAKPENTTTKIGFLDNRQKTSEAKQLLIEALDEAAIENEKKTSAQQITTTGKRNFEIILENTIAEQHFPPCIQQLLKGTTDGKKRGLFILLNFLKTTGYPQKEIERIIAEWNAKNTPPVSSTIIQGQLHYQKERKPIPPPNCTATGYYLTMGICHPDETCAKITNPTGYAMRKQRGAQWREERIKEENEKTNG